LRVYIFLWGHFLANKVLGSHRKSEQAQNSDQRLEAMGKHDQGYEFYFPRFDQLSLLSQYNDLPMQFRRKASAFWKCPSLLNTAPA
jgi:hypothetical protein